MVLDGLLEKRFVVGGTQIFGTSPGIASESAVVAAAVVVFTAGGNAPLVA